MLTIPLRESFEISRLFENSKAETDDEMDSNESSRSSNEVAGHLVRTPTLSESAVNYSRTERQNSVNLPAGVLTIQFSEKLDLKEQWEYHFFWLIASPDNF